MADMHNVWQVENIALLANAPDNQFVGVNMYCADDAGSYNAPTNMRASQISQRCGKPLDVSLICLDHRAGMRQSGCCMVRMPVAS